MKGIRNSNKVFIVGVGMSKFYKPGGHSFSYIDLGTTAVKRALLDSGISYSLIEEAIVGYVFNDSCAGQRVLYNVGMTGIPVVNVNNNCATGSSAFNLCYKSVKSGAIECALALGFETMKKGPLPLDGSSTTAPVYNHLKPLIDQGKMDSKIPQTPQIFAAAGKEHNEKYGSTQDHLSKISVKNYSHGSNNPYAQFQKKITIDQVKNSPSVCSPLNKLHCCPTSDGAAAVILCSEEFITKHNLQDQAVEILASVLFTDKKETFEGNSYINLVGGELARRTAEEAYKQAGITSKDIDVVELHDCFAANELITYEALGLCEKGKAAEFVDKGDNTYGGKYVVNPSGGLTAKGHPLGATGLAQLTELTWQLRNMSEKRQVKGAKYCLAHNLGLGSAIVVTILKKFNQNFNLKEHQSSDPNVLEKFEKLNIQAKF